MTNKTNYNFDDKKHIHTLDGIPLHGVTTVLSVISKPQLIQWSANMAVDFLKDRRLQLKDSIAIFPEEEELLWKEARVAHRIKKE